MRREAQPKGHPQTPSFPRHPLNGAGLHYLREDGYVQYQACIVGVVPSGCASVGDLALIQYFEWFMGEPSTQRLVPLADIARDDRWVIFRDVAEMNDHFERVDKHRNEHLHRQKKAEAQAAGDGQE